MPKAEDEVALKAVAEIAEKAPRALRVKEAVQVDVSLLNFDEKMQA